MPSSINKLRKIGKFAVWSWHSSESAQFCFVCHSRPFTALRKINKSLFGKFHLGQRGTFFKQKLPPFIKSRGVFYFSNSISLLSGMETKDCKWYVCIHCYPWMLQWRAKHWLYVQWLLTVVLSTVPIGATVAFFSRCIVIGSSVLKSWLSLLKLSTAIVFSLSWNEIQKWIVIQYEYYL